MRMESRHSPILVLLAEQRGRVAVHQRIRFVLLPTFLDAFNATSAVERMCWELFFHSLCVFFIFELFFGKHFAMVGHYIANCECVHVWKSFSVSAGPISEAGEFAKLMEIVSLVGQSSFATRLVVGLLPISWMRRIRELFANQCSSNHRLHEARLDCFARVLLFHLPFTCCSSRI
jgi:hypothetical protein